MANTLFYMKDINYKDFVINDSISKYNELLNEFMIVNESCFQNLGFVIVNQIEVVGF